MALQCALLLELHDFQKNGDRAPQIQALVANLLKFEIKLERITSILVGHHEEAMRQICTFITKYGSVPGGTSCMERATDNVSLADSKWAFSSSASAKENEKED